MPDSHQYSTERRLKSPQSSPIPTDCSAEHSSASQLWVSGALETRSLACKHTASVSFKQTTKMNRPTLTEINHMIRNSVQTTGFLMKFKMKMLEEMFPSSGDAERENAAEAASGHHASTSSTIGIVSDDFHGHEQASAAADDSDVRLALTQASDSHNDESGFFEDATGGMHLSTDTGSAPLDGDLDDESIFPCETDVIPMIFQSLPAAASSQSNEPSLAIAQSSSSMTQAASCFSERFGLSASGIMCGIDNLPKFSSPKSGHVAEGDKDLLGKYYSVRDIMIFNAHWKELQSSATTDFFAGDINWSPLIYSSSSYQ